MKIKHKKIKNTGLLYEVLNQIMVKEIMEGKDSKVPYIIKRNFKGELLKEFKIYKAFNNVPKEGNIESYIDNILEGISKLNYSKLNKQKYNLIKEIKELYNIDKFFDIKIKNYKQLASISNLIESKLSNKFIDPSFVIQNKQTLINEIKKVDNKNNKKELLENYSTEDRLFVYNRMIELFNKTYGNVLNENQKKLINYYINNKSNSELQSVLKENYNIIKKELTENIINIQDDIERIKLKEVINLIPEIKPNKKVGDECISRQMKFWEILNEVKNAH